MTRSLAVIPILLAHLFMSNKKNVFEIFKGWGLLAISLRTSPDFLNFRARP